MIISAYAIPGKKFTEPLPSTLNRLKPDEMVLKIRCEVLYFYKMTPEQVFRKCRKRELVLPRQVMHYLAKKYTNLSLICIGQEFPNRIPFNHTSVRHSIQTVMDLMETDANIKGQVNAIEYNMGCDPNERVVIVTPSNQIISVKKDDPHVPAKIITMSESEKVIAKYL